jgi:hypothetical protein
MQRYLPTATCTANNALTEAKRGRERVPNLPAVSLTGCWDLTMSILVKYLYRPDWLYQSLAYTAWYTASLWFTQNEASVL